MEFCHELDRLQEVGLIELLCEQFARGLAKELGADFTEDPAAGRLDFEMDSFFSGRTLGIEPGDLICIFSHGFTTKKHGHGFGLHSSANAAREMGGALTVHSDGPGCGARFTVELPVVPMEIATVPVDA